MANLFLCLYSIRTETYVRSPELQRFPFERWHISDTVLSVVAPEYPASCSALNHFDLLYVLSSVRAPDSGTIFNSQSHKYDIDIRSDNPFKYVKRLPPYSLNRYNI